MKQSEAALPIADGQRAYGAVCALLPDHATTFDGITDNCHAWRGWDRFKGAADVRPEFPAAGCGQVIAESTSSTRGSRSWPAKRNRPVHRAPADKQIPDEAIGLTLLCAKPEPPATV